MKLLLITIVILGTHGSAATSITEKGISSVVSAEENTGLTSDQVNSKALPVWNGGLDHTQFGETLPQDRKFYTSGSDRTSGSHTSRPYTSRPNTSRPNTSRPNTSRPNTSRPNTSRPNTSRPNTSRPNTSRPRTNMPGPIVTPPRQTISTPAWPTYGPPRPPGQPQPPYNPGYPPIRPPWPPGQARPPGTSSARPTAHASMFAIFLTVIFTQRAFGLV